MNIYLNRFALRNHKKNIGKTFIAFDESEPQKVLGYHTVSMAQIAFHELPENMKKGIPRYPVPAFRIGKLAINSSMQGKGFEAYLLKDALSRALTVSQKVAVYCILVDALNENAKAFYLEYGFIPFEESPLTLELPMKTIEMAL